VLEFRAEAPRPRSFLCSLPRNIASRRCFLAWVKVYRARRRSPAVLAVRMARWSHAARWSRAAFMSPHVVKSAWWSHPMCAARASAARCRRIRFAGARRRAGKTSVSMTVYQQGAITLFGASAQGRSAVARSRPDVDGRKHDIVVLGHNVGGSAGLRWRPMGCPGLARIRARIGGGLNMARQSVIG